MFRSYLPHTEADRKAMLAAIGLEMEEQLFDVIPPQLRFNRMLNLPASLPEAELVRHTRQLAGRNADLLQYTCFLGAGAYDHYIPSVVDHVTGRSEFYTSYTQYQPEAAQGYLQALWEFQTMICELTGMEVANASMYDAATAAAEAAMMACGATGRSRLLVAKTVHPHYRQVLSTYGRDRKYRIQEIEYRQGTTDLERLKVATGPEIAAIIVQSPNFFGCIEELDAAARMAHAAGALLIVLADPVSLGILASPGSFGADIVAGEGQGLGLPISFGGPYLGFLATTAKWMRRLPGRIIGQTTDADGKRGFVLTLQAREQHIRREKANSNICSNEALCALRAAVYLSAAGKDGIQRIAGLSLQKAHYACRELAKLPGCRPVFAAPFFKEFVIATSRPVAEVNAVLFENQIIGGLDLARYYPELAGCMLLCVTENRTRDEIDRLAAVLGGIL
ncbi:glycine cleavage system p-protein [Lucifera butyrica]|uniref:Probable glycine dehydrogenase (decarboxylating) subunit 1 n=1 Tax=Lucifera butyrica TaxID=1351585 RepID=A0A498RGU2_9FIRM|nr:aminomethyl-transferring glycine dehydrogenase subunit GcvPA [Lucifera butyrica]VBB08348.1 glycine cleavage system p-protein [Lucifera butyrica]